MGILNKLFKLVFGSRDLGAQKDPGLVRAKVQMEGRSLAAELDATYEAWQQAASSYESARESGKPRHQLEELYQNAMRLERAFGNLQTSRRDVREDLDRIEQTEAMRQRMARLLGDSFADDKVTARDEFVARQQRAVEMDEMAMHEEIMAEETRAQESRHAPPDLGASEKERDIDLGLDEQPAGSGKKQPELS